MMNAQPIEQRSTSFDAASNWKLYVEQSKNFKSRTVYPTTRSAINPNAKPLKLDPPK